MADDPATPSTAEEPEEEKPNLPRIIVLAVLLLGLTGYLYYVRVLHPPPAHETYTTLPGVNVAGLSDPQQQQLLEAANKMTCGCGQDVCTGHDWTLAECRNHDPSCNMSLDKLNLMAANLRAGKPMLDEVEKVKFIRPGMHPAPAGSGSPAASGSPMTAASGSPATTASGSPVPACCGGHSSSPH